MQIELSTETCDRLKQMMHSYENYELVIRRLLDSVGNPTTARSQGVAVEVVRKRSVPENPSSASLLRKSSGAKSALAARPSANFEYSAEDKAGARRYEKGDYAPLTHTKIFDVMINGKPEKASWDSIIKDLLHLIHQAGGPIDDNLHPKLRIRKGEFHEQGYKYLPDIDASVQGTSGDNAGKVIMDLAAKWNISIEIFFGWREKKGAMYPGEFGLIKI